MLPQRPNPAAAIAMTNPALITFAEQSGLKKTGRYAEVEALCAAFASAYPDAVRSFSIGTTPEGRPLMALVASRTGSLDAATLQARGTPILYWQGGIHPGESDGKDAGFIVLREWLAGSGNPLDEIAVLFVPVINADGHERFGPWNRPNQVGPEEMGWRTTAQNLNLNRDYGKAEAPEMQALIRLLGEWDPIVYADLHVTDGADFEHDISITGTPIFEGDPRLHRAGRALRDGIIEHLAANGSLPLDFYPNLLVQDDPASGFAVDAHPVRYSTGYWALRNRFAILVETHSWKPYAQRIVSTCHTLRALALLTAAHGAEWRKLAATVDASDFGGQTIALDYEADPHTVQLEFRGFAYTREPSAISGGLVTRYDPSTPQIWKIPLHDGVRTTVSTVAPKGGYIVPAAWAALMAEKLALHGIAFHKIAAAQGKLALEAFRASSVTYAPGTFEGRTMPTVQGRWQAEAREVPAGSLFVPIAQPKARLLMALLEPEAPDSFVAWGYFNAVFEKKEYVEPYVAEQIARELLAKDPALNTAFKARLQSDAAFARDPEARLEFFYRLHPSWDERHNLYPVYRSDVVL